MSIETEVTTEVVGKTFWVLVDGARVGHGLVYGRNVVIEGKVFSKAKAIRHLTTSHKKGANYV